VVADIEEERLAGVSHERLGRPPEPGDVIRVDGVEIVVRRMDDNKLEKVLVRRVPDEPGAA
jgi:CBS domain containing-hemolysin-like protein